MAKGDRPIAVQREENISVSAWENPKKSGDGTYRTVSIDIGRATKETKDLPKGHPDKKYVHNKVSVMYRQLDVLIKLLTAIKEQTTTNQ